MSEIILSGRGVVKRFSGLTATENVDFDIPAGSIYGLIGPNGAGKSTLFNLITGYYGLSGGEIRFKGQSLAGIPTYRRNQMGIARAFQISKPFPALTVRENIRVGAMFGRPEKVDHEKVVDDALAITGIADIADRTAEGLTVGTLRKLEIARAIATRPSLLLADEPCAGLNPTETQEMVNCLRNVRDKGITVMEEGFEHPQGPKRFDARIHQVFGIQNISVVENGRLDVVHKTTIEDGLYEPEADYTAQSF